MPAEAAAAADADARVAPAILRFESVGLSAGTAPILSDINLEIARGGATVVMGPNGAGKTSLLRLMMGLVPASTGRLVAGTRADGTPIRCAFVFQRPVMLKRTAAANVAFARRAAGLEADRDTVARLLGEVGLLELAAHPARRLSGGEQQRLALARALAREPDLLLLDEPTASLDPAQTSAVEAIIACTAARGVTVIMSTHNPGQARRLARSIVLLAQGRIAEHAPADDFLDQPRTEIARRFLAGDLIL